MTASRANTLLFMILKGQSNATVSSSLHWGSLVSEGLDFLENDTSQIEPLTLLLQKSQWLYLGCVIGNTEDEVCHIVTENAYISMESSNGKV